MSEILSPINELATSKGTTKDVSKKVFIKTFGCQMNEYDSDKMVDVLHAAEGYVATQNVEEADLILFNTCSVREKAQEKVFSDLGRIKHLKAKGVKIGVGGCVASQEGAAIIARAPFVDVVFGPQTLHRLPELLAKRDSLARPQVDISFPEIEKFDHLPPAKNNGASAVPIPQARLFQDPHDLPLWHLGFRHHVAVRAAGGDVPRPVDRMCGQSGDLERKRCAVRRHHPARLHQL